MFIRDHYAGSASLSPVVSYWSITVLAVSPEGLTLVTSLAKLHSGSSSPKLLLAACHAVPEILLLFWRWHLSS